jgi:ribosomal protein S12 methylthiotransferase
LKPKFSSLTVEEIVRQAAALDAQGIREINLIGQDSSGYGLDLYKDLKLAELVKKIARAARSVSWIRLLYLYPSRITDELLKVVRDEPKVCKYIDVPVQHISASVLRSMNRKTSKKDIVALLSKIRTMIPGAALRTSVIVGFPGETDRDFKELLAFIKDFQFERLGAFIYSKEEGTKAYSMPGQIPQKVKEARFDEIMRLQQSIAAQVNSRSQEKTIDVLIEERQETSKSAEKEYIGRSQFDAPEVDGSVFVRSKKTLQLGSIVPVHITDTLEYDLVGEAVDEHC